jgi:hypothetical protein
VDATGNVVWRSFALVTASPHSAFAQQAASAETGPLSAQAIQAEGAAGQFGLSARSPEVGFGRRAQKFRRLE